jgi:hypothetical protein
VSGLRDPLSKRVVGKNRLIALGLKPSTVPTRFRFMTAPPDAHPAAGYTLTVRRVPDGKPKEVGTTDREGRIVLPPGFADGLVVYRLLAGDIEPLVEFPGMPGETTDERIIKLNPLTQTVTLESRLTALKGEVLDQVAIRKRLEARLKSRFNAEAWDEIKTILTEYHKLRPRSAFVERLEGLREDAKKQQKETKKPVLTRTAQAQLDDAEGLIMQGIDDEIFAAYERGLKEAQELAAAEAKKAAAKKRGPAPALSTVKSPPKAGVASPPVAVQLTPKNRPPALTPAKPAAAAPQEKAKSGGAPKAF